MNEDKLRDYLKWTTADVHETRVGGEGQPGDAEPRNPSERVQGTSKEESGNHVFHSLTLPRDPLADATTVFVSGIP